LVYGVRRQPREVLHVYDELSALCAAHGIAQEQQWTVPLRGRALVELGHVNHGLPELASGLEAHALTRSALMRPYFFVLYAGGLLRARRIDAADEALRTAQESEEATRQRCYTSERWRLQAEVQVARGDAAAAERAYRESLAVAQSQSARWLELRTARGFATFLLGAGRSAEARAVLQPIVEWFTEGFDTLDYAYSDALLKTLA
jgi:hypothetical protein